MNELINEILNQPQYVPYASKIKTIIEVEIETTKTIPDKDTIKSIADDVIFVIKKNKKNKSLRPPIDAIQPTRKMKSAKILDIDDQELLRLIKKGKEK